MRKNGVLFTKKETALEVEWKRGHEPCLLSDKRQVIRHFDMNLIDIWPGHEIDPKKWIHVSLKWTTHAFGLNEPNNHIPRTSKFANFFSFLCFFFWGPAAARWSMSLQTWFMCMFLKLCSLPTEFWMTFCSLSHVVNYNSVCVYVCEVLKCQVSESIFVFCTRQWTRYAS